MPKGGYRWNAGRPASHVKAEHCRRIEAGRWAKEGIFNAGRSGGWAWKDADTGETLASIGYRGMGRAVSLNFAVNGQPVNQLISQTCNIHFHATRRRDEPVEHRVFMTGGAAADAIERYWHCGCG